MNDSMSCGDFSMISVSCEYNMSLDQMKLWKDIQKFSIDKPDVDLPFSRRISRDNQWSDLYTQRAIEEYKRFIFLAMVLHQGVTPSDAVDQIWHCHLTYTHSYWNELCAVVLKQPLHHCPSRGGAEQNVFFRQAYENTLASYRHFFAQHPPADIWPEPEVRFSPTIQFQRINVSAHWILPKPSLPLPFRKYFLRDWRTGRRAIAVCVLVLVLSLTPPVSWLGATAGPTGARYGLQAQRAQISPSPSGETQPTDNTPPASIDPASTEDSEPSAAAPKRSWPWGWLVFWFLAFVFGSSSGGSSSHDSRRDDNNCHGCACAF